MHVLLDIPANTVCSVPTCKEPHWDGKKQWRNLKKEDSQRYGVDWDDAEKRYAQNVQNPVGVRRPVAHAAPRHDF